ncbi:PREDICTED: LOW QUALITY PROTEIN: ankyrin repeat-containing protein C6C3.08-like [Populus euphratica]|uniref:LOW QUALITY PROTEIN: ankyrin repeat-containing protein C6C3.08-like n=1 Tax=Populus euphratica TaxID=75702 RepID=A0AAJ6XF55_POPEU|nr:PREDICTED: LOW QUALITY PROTEIN: ankyrin repeat-containing protein C6C3.08-like [Populus euphratica]
MVTKKLPNSSFRDPEVAYYNNKTGRSPLYLAVENRDRSGILDDLLNTEAPIPTEREDGDSLGMLPQGKSPVHAAVDNRIIGILQKIEEAKPELLRLHDKEFGNPLHYASSTGYVQGVRFLLEKYRAGADETDQEGNYPIHLACKEGSVALLKEFLKVIPYPNEFINKKKAEHSSCSGPKWTWLFDYVHTRTGSEDRRNTAKCDG